VNLRDGEDGISPGQACVFYDSGESRAQVLGGGWIKASPPAENASIIY
jgi:tRNA-specific 2-thiouridylase